MGRLLAVAGDEDEGEEVKDEHGEEATANNYNDF